MNESIKDLVNAMLAKDASATESAFQSAMAEKISAKLDDMRSNVAQSMFKTVTEQPEVSEAEPVVEEGWDPEQFGSDGSGAGGAGAGDVSNKDKKKKKAAAC